MEGLQDASPPRRRRRGGEVILVAGVGDGREVELKLPGRFALDPAVRGALKTAPGVAFLEEVKDSPGGRGGPAPKAREIGG